MSTGVFIAVDQAVQSATSCVAQSDSTCAAVVAIVNAQAQTITSTVTSCANGTNNVCNELVFLAQGEVATAVALAQRCVGGQDATCNALLASVSDLLTAAVTCIVGPVGPDDPSALTAVLTAVLPDAQATCEQVKTAALQAIAPVLMAAQSCLAGTDSTCSTAAGLVAQVEWIAESITAIAQSCADPSAGCAVNFAVSNLFGPGDLPGATDPDALTVDPAAASAKEQLVANNQVAVTQDLVAGVNQQPPPDTDVPSSPDPNQPADGTPTTSWKVQISGYGQGYHPWCVAASTATTLSAFNVSSNVQDVAYAEKWNGSPNTGITFGNARAYLNKHETRNYYQFNAVGSSAQLWSHVTTDIYNKQAPVIIAVDTHQLSWWRDSKTQGLHALTIFLYYSSANGGFNVWDSADNYNNGAKEAISLANTWTAMSAGGAGDEEIW